MQIDKNKKEQTVGMGIIGKGDYVAEIQEGITKYDSTTSDNIDDERISLGIPLKTIDVYDKKDNSGDEKSVGMTYVHFIPIRTKEGKLAKNAEDDLNAYVVITDQIESFLKKFSEYDNIVELIKKDFNTFLEWMQLKLVDCQVGVTFTHGKKYRSDEMEHKLSKFWEVTGGKQKPVTDDGSDGEW
jgi:hypothetical protein